MVFVTLPFILPVLGVQLSDLVFAVPLIVLVLASIACFDVARVRAPRRPMFALLAATGAIAALASALGIAAALAHLPAAIPFYVGCAASLTLAAASLSLARCSAREARGVTLVDPLILTAPVVGLVVWFVVVPVLGHGDPLLGVVVLVDLVALLAATASSVGAVPRPIWGGLVVAVVAATGGDALVAAGSAGLAHVSGAVTALLWAAAGLPIWRAAEVERALRRSSEDRPTPRTAPSWLAILLPLAGVLVPLATLGLLALENGKLKDSELAYFSALFLGVLGAAFTRQAWLLVDNGRAAARDRAQRVEFQRRTEELEALTGLATTMTETLDEPALIERGLDVLRVAARTTSAALHLRRGDAVVLAAAAGAWQTERVWTQDTTGQERELVRRGRREVATLPLSARGRLLGHVTLVRPEREPFGAELELLGLLTGQLAVALQNARDYHERLEQATHDPLTGLYNRRWFYEALAGEAHRHDRHGTPFALAMLDIDDFKAVNDTFGHAAGDQVLVAVADILSGLARGSDTLARIGGEEFGLLMPGTSQLDALLAVERLRNGVARARVLEERAVTLSAGASACPENGSRREDLERAADEALYWAKRNGKNLCAVASEVTAAATGADTGGLLSHLHGVVAGIDGRSLHTRDHSENVSAYAVALGQALGLEAERVVRLRRAAFLHDVGKVAVSSAVLGKPDTLTDDEFALIRLHPAVGGEMLAHAGLHEEAGWVRHHHERLDGRGYPDGIAGDEIPLEARILFAADSFEAMTSDRPYRRGRPVEEALDELRACAGTQFDAHVAETLAQLVTSGRLEVRALRDERARTAF